MVLHLAASSDQDDEVQVEPDSEAGEGDWALIRALEAEEID